MILIVYFLFWNIHYVYSISCPIVGVTITVPKGTLTTRETLSDGQTVRLSLISNSPVNNTCKGVSCGDNGLCFSGTCRCSNGFTGTNCNIPPVDPCAGLNCGLYGTCSKGKCICTDGYSGTVCEKIPQQQGNSVQVIYDSPLPLHPTVGYVGGSNYDGTFSFGDIPRLGHYDFLIVGFANYWNTKCSGPTEDGLNGATPSLLTNACIQRGPKWLSKPALWGNCPLTDCRGDGEGTVGYDVLQFQQQGGRILLSVGGASADATDMNPAAGKGLAISLWNMYLGGSDKRYDGWRPFGPDVVLDGIDLDLEQSPSNCPSSAICTNIVRGWYEFLRTMRGLMDADTRKKYIITAVPINTKYADPTISFTDYGSYTYGYLPGIKNCESIWDPLSDRATSALAQQPAESIYKILYMIDYLWPQFYPSPVQITLNGDCWINDLLAWTTMCVKSTPAGQKQRCRVGVGIPYSAGAAEGGQIDANLAVQKIIDAMKSHSIIASNFGGMFGWDEYWDHTQNGGTFSKKLASGMKKLNL